MTLAAAARPRGPAASLCSTEHPNVRENTPWPSPTGSSRACSRSRISRRRMKVARPPAEARRRGLIWARRLPAVVRPTDRPARGARRGRPDPPAAAPGSSRRSHPGRPSVWSWCRSVRSSPTSSARETTTLLVNALAARSRHRRRLDRIRRHGRDIAAAWLRTPARNPGRAWPTRARMDTVELLVRDLDAMTSFYREPSPSTCSTQSGTDRPLLGTTAALPIMVLRHSPDLPAPRTLARRALSHGHPLPGSASARRIPRFRWPSASPHLYEGSADHLVSEAFYFTRSRGQRPRALPRPPARAVAVLRGRRIVLMARSRSTRTRSCSVARIRRIAARRRRSAAIGHVHLQVGDIPRRTRFYVDALGLDVTVDLGSAHVRLRGGYHHHIGDQHLAERGRRTSRRRPSGSATCASQLPSREDVEALGERLRSPASSAATTAPRCISPTRGARRSSPRPTRPDQRAFAPPPPPVRRRPGRCRPCRTCRHRAERR